MKHTKSIFAAVLAAALAISAPLSASASLVSPPEYEAKMTLVVDGPYYKPYEDLIAGKYEATVTLADAGYRLTGAVVTYGGETVYDGPAGYVGTFPESVYLYADGTLKVFENGEVTDVLTVDGNLQCEAVSESGGVVWAYFLDTQSRDIYSYNLEDGSFAKGNIGQVFFRPVFDVPYAWSDMFIDRVGDYFVIGEIVENDVKTSKCLVFKQEGGALTVFEPDISNVKNSNPKGKELILVGYADGFGYLDGTGTARGFYDDASAFFYNDRGEGVAFVTTGGEGYFVDKYLNRVSDPISPVNGAFCSKDGIFEIYYNDETAKTYTVELVRKDNLSTVIMPVFGLMLVAAAAAVVITAIRKRGKDNKDKVGNLQ